MAAVDRLILPRCQHHAALGMRERRVIDVLAHVELVEPHGAVRSERDILRVREIEVVLVRRRVLELHVPEPGRRALARGRARASSRIRATSRVPTKRPLWRGRLESRRTCGAQQRRPLRRSRTRRR